MKVFAELIMKERVEDFEYDESSSVSTLTGRDGVRCSITEDIQTRSLNEEAVLTQIEVPKENRKRKRIPNVQKLRIKMKESKIISHNI